MAGNTISLRSDGKGVLAEIIVAAEVERVWRVLTSFEEMPAHLRGLQQSRILRREGSYRLVEQMARVGIPLLQFSFRVVMNVVEEKPFLYFNQRFGPFSSFRGHWRVDPSLARNGTRVRYYLEASLGQGLRRRAVDHQLHRIIRQNFKDLAVWIEDSGT